MWTTVAALIQATSVVVAPSPPAPRVPALTSSRAGDMISVLPARGERFMVDVEVRAGGDVLWSGPMTVATASGTNFNRRLSEPAADCAAIPYGQQTENSLSVQLTAARSFDRLGSMSVSVRWSRSLPGTCPFPVNSRTIELAETVALAPGQATTISGDGGLTVRLKRRA